MYTSCINKIKTHNPNDKAKQNRAKLYLQQHTFTPHIKPTNSISEPSYLINLNEMLNINKHKHTSYRTPLNTINLCRLHPFLSFTNSNFNNKIRAFKFLTLYYYVPGGIIIHLSYILKNKTKQKTHFMYSLLVILF